MSQPQDPDKSCVMAAVEEPKYSRLVQAVDYNPELHYRLPFGCLMDKVVPTPVLIIVMCLFALYVFLHH